MELVEHEAVRDGSTSFRHVSTESMDEKMSTVGMAL